jgi:hypothetical protein
VGSAAKARAKAGSPADLSSVASVKEEGRSEGSEFEPRISQSAQVKTEERSARPNHRSERADRNRKTGKVAKASGL